MILFVSKSVQFRLDIDTHQFWRGEESIHLTRMEWSALQYLVENAGALVTKEAFWKKVWGEDHFVNETSFARMVFELRHKLGDDSDAPEIIKTVHGVGYRFMAKVENTTQGKAKNEADEAVLDIKEQDSYQIVATKTAPALIIYLLDVSQSMSQDLEGKSKLRHVVEAMKAIADTMVDRSTKGSAISPRYQVAACAYSSTRQDLLQGIRSIDRVADKMELELTAASDTHTEEAFHWAAALLRKELPSYGRRPAPMVCHLTDGHYTSHSPLPVAQEIMQMRTADGNVLVENIYVGQNLTSTAISNPKLWKGILSRTELADQYARELFEMSSKLPRSYAGLLERDGYSLEPGCRMLFPVSSPGLLKLAFAASGASPTSRVVLPQVGLSGRSGGAR